MFLKSKPSTEKKKIKTSLQKIPKIIRIHLNRTSGFHKQI